MQQMATPLSRKDNSKLYMTQHFSGRIAPKYWEPKLASWTTCQTQQAEQSNVDTGWKDRLR